MVLMTEAFFDPARLLVDVRQAEPTPNPHLRRAGKAIDLRENHHFGPGKFATYLRHCHDVEVSGLRRVEGLDSAFAPTRRARRSG